MVPASNHRSQVLFCCFCAFARCRSRLGLTKVDVLGFSIGSMSSQLIALDRPDLVRRLVIVGSGPRNGDHMAEFTPEANTVFGTKYVNPDDFWIDGFFTPSPESQAAGRAFLKRRDAPISDKVLPAQAAAFSEWGQPVGERYAYQKKNADAGSCGQRESRHYRLCHQLACSRTESTTRADVSLPRRGSWFAVPISRVVCRAHRHLPARLNCSLSADWSATSRCRFTMKSSRRLPGNKVYREEYGFTGEA
jgi:pimeloyl-ACP methyl ester carboxylesterase